MMRILCGAFVTVGWCSIGVGQVPTFNDVNVATVPDATGSPVTLRMDIYKPANTTGPTPIVAWIHGGGWQSGTYNSGLNNLKNQLLQQGIAVANIGYRLSGQEIFPAQIHDVKGMIRHLRANAATYGVDPRRIGAWGTSAGGHLTALLSTSASVAALEGTTGGNLDQPSSVLVGADYFGPTDLLAMALDVTTPPGASINHDAYTSAESKLIGFDEPGQGIGVLRANLSNPATPFPELAALVAQLNPLSHLDATDPVMFVGHGTSDTVVPLRQSTRLHDALAAQGVPHTYMESIGAGHGALGTTVDSAALAFVVDELTRPFGDATRDDQINFDDLLVIAQNYQGTNRGWRQGDFDADGIVGFSDLLLLAQNYGGTSFNSDWLLARSLVPEPATLGLVGLAFFVAGRDRRRVL